MSVEVVDNPVEHRYEVHVDGEKAGHADYVRKGALLIFTHTEVDSAYEGKGIGSQLAKGALDAARAAGDPIVPLCPFIAAYIGRHTEYDDLVDHACLAYLETRPRPRR